MNDFNQFLDEINDFKEKPVKLKQIKKILKINEKSFPPYKNILNYYFQEFSKRTNEEHRTKWHRKDKILFVWTVLKYFELTKKSDLNPSDQDWHFLSKVLGVSEQLLNLKWISMLKTNLKMSPWNLEEDDVLSQIITNAGELKNWTQITIDFNRVNPTKIVRHAKQIRERWNNYLNPDLKKSEWSQEEQLQLLELVKELGKRWSLISKRIPGRTENQVKNQYNSMINNCRRLNQLDNEDVAIHKLLANLQGIDYEGPLPLSTKRNRKVIKQQENNKPIKNNIESIQQEPIINNNNEQQEIKEEHQVDDQQQEQLLQQVSSQQLLQQSSQMMMNIPVFSPLLPFSPLHYLLQQSPNQVQSPFEMASFPGQIYDELLKSQKDVGKDTPYLEMFNSPPINHGFPFATMNFNQGEKQQHSTYDVSKIKAIQKNLLNFDTNLNKDL